MSGGRSGRKRAQQRRPTCEICGREVSKATEEHVYPSWLLRHTRASFRNPPPDFVPVPGWEQDPKVVLKPVCERCQRRLNSAFEIRAKDLLIQMLDTPPVDLSPERRSVLAAWFCKTALVLVLAREKRSSAPVLTQRQSSRVRTMLRQMVKTGQLPQNAAVRIAHRSLAASRAERRFVPEPLNNDPAILTCAYAFEDIMCEVILDAHSHNVARHLTLTNDDQRFIQLWPQPGHESLRWPPAASVSYADIHQLTSEWQHDPANEKAMFRLFPRASGDQPPP
jgi:hypothetical protein